MPRATKKKETKAPEPAMYMEIFAALRMLEKERGIPVDYMVDKIKQCKKETVEEEISQQLEKVLQDSFVQNSES